MYLLHKNKKVAVHTFLLPGDTFVSLSYLFRLGKSTISEIITEVCQAVVEELQTEYIQVTTTYQWTELHECSDLLNLMYAQLLVLM